MFLLFLGYFIASSQKTAKQLIIRGTKIIFLGLALNVALNLNLFIVVGKGEYPHINTFQYIFGVDILLHAGLSIIIIALSRKLIDKHIVVPLLLALSAALLGNLSSEISPGSEHKPLLYLSSFIYGDSWWSYFPLFPWLSYSFAGIALYKVMQRFDFSYFSKLKSKIVIGVLFILFLIFTIQYAISVASELQSYYHHGIVFFCWTMVFLTFYGLLADALEKVAGNSIYFRYLKWLGKNITVIYTIQWIIIGNTATEIYKSVDSPGWLVAAFILVSAVSSGLCHLWIKSRARL